MNHKLTKDQIQFIDNYLTNSGVYFTDIKMEMVDHVASEIENSIKNGDQRDFYYIFKDFMVENKSSLIKRSDRFYKASDKRILKNVVHKTFSFRGLIIVISIFLSFKLLEKFLNVEQILSVLKYAPFTILITGTIGYLALTRIRKERFSSLERIGFYFYIISQILFQFFNPILKIDTISTDKLLRMEIGASLIIFVLINLMISAFEFKQDYAKYYQAV